MKRSVLLLLLTTLCNFCAYSQDTTFSTSMQGGNTFFSLNNKVGLWDKDKKWIIPAQYDELADVRFGLVKATLKNKVGFIDVNNTIKIPFIYEEDTSMYIGARIYKIEDYDKAGKIVRTSLSIGVDKYFTNFSKGLCAVIKNGKYGFIDTLGNVVVPFQFNGADNFYNELAIVKTGNKYGAINNTGKLVIPAVYDKLVVAESDALYAQKDGEAFYIDYAGIRKRESYPK